MFRYGYTITTEWCGYEEPRYVVRHSDSFLESFACEDAARDYIELETKELS